MKKKGLNMEQKRNLTGWAFLLPAALREKSRVNAKKIK